jgi:hypothetical protein
VIQKGLRAVLARKTKMEFEMSESVISVGFQVPGGNIENTDFSETISLMDWDIAILTTNLRGSFYFGSATYNGKTCLSDDSSFKYGEGINYWKNEIKDAYRNGKSIIILLDGYDEIYVATGQKAYSGTGRNRQTTRMVSEANNYKILPFEYSVRNSTGSQMKLNTKYPYLREYWLSFAKNSTYKVIIESKAFTPMVLTKSGEKMVGGLLINKETNGFILLLPFIDFENEDYTEVRNEKTYWSKKGKAFGQLFVSSIIGINTQIKALSNKTPQPGWILDPRYLLEKEKNLREIMIEKEEKVRTVQSEIQNLKDELNEEISIKDLLFEQGKPLEDAIFKALKTIGFSTSQYKENDSEFDVVFECSEGRLLGEAEGKDNKAINIDKLRQLEMNINEDLAREEVTSPAKAVLFGNAYRLLPIVERKEIFTEKCLIASERSKVALINTVDLFFICKKRESLSEDDKQNIRMKILSTTGIVDFSSYLDSDEKDINSEEK